MSRPNFIPKGWNLPDSLFKRLGKEVGRQRAMFEEGHLLVVLHRAPNVGEVKREGRLFWIEPNGQLHSSEFGDRPGCLQSHLDHFSEIVSKYDQEEENAESADDYFDLLRNLSPVMRAARNTYAALEDARRLLPDNTDLLNARDRAYEIERIAELVYNDGKLGLEYAMAKQAEMNASSVQQMARASYRLNLLASFFFPLATLGAIFGMNLTSNLEGHRPPWAFVTVIAVGVVSGLFLRWFVTRERKVT